MTEQNNLKNIKRPTRYNVSKLSIIVKALSAAVTATIVAPAYGDSSPQRASQLQEIVVTASRREEGVQSVPSSIAAVSSADLESKGITDFADVTKAVSGLYLVQSTNMTVSSLRVRGVGTPGITANDPSVGVVLDGVYQARPGAAFTELMDVDRIEVLRGPQGTNFGKNTTSGVIAIHTKNPDLEDVSGRLQGVVGNLNNREARGVINIPIVEGKLAARIGGFHAERDGYTKNVFLDEKTRSLDRKGGRVKVLWQAKEGLRFTFSAENLEQKSRLDQGMVEYGLLALGPNVLPYETWYENLGLGSPPPIELGKSQQDFSDQSMDKVERYILNINWDVRNHTISSITGLEKIRTSLEYDRDRSTLPLTVLTTQPETDVLTQEVQVSSNVEGPFSYILGAFYQNEELYSNSLINGSSVSLTERDLDSRALFGNIAYDFTNRLSAIFGLRWTEDEKSNAGIDKTFREITYTAKATYQIDSDRMVYFTHDKGFKSGGINRAVGVLEPSIWDPEITYNYEIGMKGTYLDDTLRVNGALFYQTFEDYQVTTTVEANQVAHVRIGNAAKVVSQGVEIDIAALPTRNLSIDGSLTWLRTKYDDYENAPCPPNFSQCVSGSQDLTGKQLDNAPKITVNLGAEYRKPIADGVMEWFFRSDASHRSRTQLEVMQTGAVQESYTLYNARLGLETPGQWRATLWGNNLGNKKYATSGMRDETTGILLMYQGLPRTYGATIDWFF